MVAPSGEGAIRCMQMAMSTVDTPIDYLNTHGTSTPVGDVAEMKGVREVFAGKAPAISSTKSLSGHSLGAAGVHEAIYCMLMMEGNFIAGSANIEELDPAVADLPIQLQTQENAKIDTVMSNSFGFGGTNATLVLKRWQGK
jgi:3-oxoacyl-[acyl-carrier-protein] synthase-1